MGGILSAVWILLSLNLSPYTPNFGILITYDQYQTNFLAITGHHGSAGGFLG